MEQTLYKSTNRIEKIQYDFPWNDNEDHHKYNFAGWDENRFQKTQIY